MNYLGHAFLSFGNPEILVGNIIGDYVKGNLAVEKYPPGIQKGIRLHRQIDDFTDRHAAAILAKNIFRPDYGLYAGAIADVLWDHFLANDPRFFPTVKDLERFSQETYSHIEAYEDVLPEKFRPAFASMKQHNWLYHYRTVRGVENALKGLVYRASYLEDTTRAYQLFLQYFYELNQRYFELVDDVVPFVKNKIQEQF